MIKAQHKIQNYQRKNHQIWRYINWDCPAWGTERRNNEWKSIVKRPVTDHQLYQYAQSYLAWCSLGSN